MGVVFDANGFIKQNRIYLANPQKTSIGILSGARNLKFTENFNNMHEISFDIYEKLNGKPTKFYDAIEIKRLINVENVGWFQVIRINKNKDKETLETYKTVQCLSLENELISKRIDAINGVFSLYDVSDISNSLLHLIATYSGWTIGHVDSELLGLYRVFSSDTEQIYNFLTTTVSKSFECIFVFNASERTISAYKLSNLGELTNIVISKRNILNEYSEESLSDYIVTRMRVKGADGVDIRAVNFGKDTISNVSYYKVPLSEPNGWMTQGLVDAINTRDVAVASYQSSYSTLLSTYKTKQAELTTLNAELKELQSQQSAQDVVWQPLAQKYNGTPPTGTPDYTIYMNAKNSSDSYYPLIASKKTQITSKQTEINTVKSQLDTISNALNDNNFFTSDQLKELNTFLSEGEEYQDTTFVVTDQMTTEEILDLKLQLLANAKNELAIKSQPQYTITIKASNLFSIHDNKSSISYASWIQQFKVGNLITLKLRDDYWVTARLISMTIDFNNLQDIELKFSNKNRLDNELVRFAETLADAGRTSTSLDYNYFGFKDASSQASDVRQFMNSTLNATLNAVKSNDSQEMLLDTYGLHMRKWLPDTNAYSPYQAWWTNNTLLFTDDGWSSIKGGIGVFTDTSGNKTMSVFADVIAGTLLMGEKLYITNSSGTYTINNNGFTATATLSGNTYLVGINPNTPSQIFRISVNGSNKLYVDTVNNRLVMSGEINATTGTLGNLTVTGTLTGGTITGTYISGASIDGGTINGATLISTGTIGSTTLTTTIQNGQITSNGTITINTLTYTCEVSSNNIIFRNSGSTLSSYGEGAFISGSLTASGTSTLGTVTCNSLKVSNYDVITFGNKSSTTFPPQYTLSAANNVIIDGNYCATVSWCQENFQPKSSSDFRLKKSIKSLDELPIELFMELKPKMYEFKCSGYRSKIMMGFLAQQVESAFERYSLNAVDYDIVEIKNPSPYTDEGQYLLDGKLHVINYENFHAWDIHVTQILYNEVFNKVNARLESIEINNIGDRLKLIETKLNIQ